MQACTNLKNDKSCGMDGILNEMIKYGQHALLPCLEKLFNIILSSGTYPKIWGENYLITIFKSGSPSDPNNYRGIAINSCLSKLLNSILNNRLVIFLRENKILNNEQIGFRRGSRTADHIFKLKTLICKYIQKSGKIYACFVYLSKAFDSVIHSALLCKLLKNGTNGKFFNIIKSMYSCSVLRVNMDNNLSNCFKSEIGVKQLDNLNPTLFSIFINDSVIDYNT
jgi:hypothetical protein